MLRLEEKKALVADLHARSRAAQAAVLVDYRGLNVSEVNDLRMQLKQQGIYFRVTKNSVARRAVQGTEMESLNEHFRGPTALALSDDPVSTAKVLTEFARHHKALQLKVGMLQGKPLSEQELESLAKLPSREQLLTQLAVACKAPIVKAVRTLNELPTQLARAVAAVRDERAKAE